MSDRHGREWMLELGLPNTRYAEPQAVRLGPATYDFATTGDAMILVARARWPERADALFPRQVRHAFSVTDPEAVALTALRRLMRAAAPTRRCFWCAGLGRGAFDELSQCGHCGGSGWECEPLRIGRAVVDRRLLWAFCRAIPAACDWQPPECVLLGLPAEPLGSAAIESVERTLGMPRWRIEVRPLRWGEDDEEPEVFDPDGYLVEEHPAGRFELYDPTPCSVSPP